MRTPIGIDDELFQELKEQARVQDVSLAKLIEQTVRMGLTANRRRAPRKRRHREQTYDMGAPTADLDKASALAAALEDAEVIRKIALRK